MHRLFSVALSRQVEFSVIGVVNVAKKSVVFQGLLNGVPFTQSVNYDKVRSRVMTAVQMNQPRNNEELS